MSIPRILAGAALLLASGFGHAFDFKSVGAAPAILYDAPSVKGGKLYVAPRGMPVEVVLTYGEWAKVRDANGDLAWTEAKGLVAKRSVVVRNAAGAKLRASADDAAPIVMSADKGVLLDLLDPQAGGWVKVRHKDGLTGYAKTTDVWGL
jgi:SH3-like domain-containing protein